MVCPKCLGDDIYAVCSYTKETISTEEGSVRCSFDSDGDIITYDDFMEESTDEQEEDPEVDEINAMYHCECGYSTPNHEEFADHI